MTEPQLIGVHAGGPVGISSRKIGTINTDGSITEGKSIEDAIINTPEDDE